jgi:PII interaction protein X
MYLPQSLTRQPSTQSKPMSTETYLNHPTFGLLYRVCPIEETRELFATLYAQRLFFLVTTHEDGIQFEPVSRTEARLMAETRLRNLRRAKQQKELDQLQSTYKQTFQ